MSDSVGRITVPDPPSGGVFPLTPDYGSGVAIEPQVAVHQFQSANTKIEQRFVLGNGLRKFSVRRAALNNTDINRLADFWELNKGAYGQFTFNAPDGQAYACRFSDAAISWDWLIDCVASLGVSLTEVPATTKSYDISGTVERFPSATLANALLDQVQVVIPLIKIRVREQAVPDIYVSDRRVIVGGRTYQPRLMNWDGIQQTCNDGSSEGADQASFSFGNADRVFTKLANDTDIWRATVEFSLFHVGTLTKLDLWKGEIQDWNFNSGPEFKVTAFDGIYELGLPYPCRRISRTCWKIFGGPQCPYGGFGGYTSCGKGWEDCKARGMQDCFGAIVASPQSVRTKDNSSGIWGFGRNTLQSSSLVADSVYSEVLPDIWFNDPLHPIAVNAKLVEGRDEGDFYCALGIVGRGPIGDFYAGDDPSNNASNPNARWHTLDGQPNHGPGSLGLRLSRGHDPVRADDPFHYSQWFSLGEGGNGIQTYSDIKAAGTAFIEIRKKDDKGLQLSKLAEHSIQAYVSQGLAGLVWTAPGQRSLINGVSNPIWVAVNILLMAKGLWRDDPALLPAQEALFDVNEALAAAAICDEMVSPMVYRTSFASQLAV